MKPHDPPNPSPRSPTPARRRTTGSRRSSLDASDALMVLASALALALFEGPVSLRKLRAGLTGGSTDVSVGRLIAGRLVWVITLVPVLLTLWRLGARELARRRRIDESRALAAEALPFAPFLLLALGFLPGWGDTIPESWSYAMLFLFLGTVATSCALRLAIWHVAFRESPTHLHTNLALFGLTGVALALVTASWAPVAVQPHWSTLADRSPYWPTRAYVGLWTTWVTWLSLPLLTLPGALVASGHRSGARVAALLIASGAVVLGVGKASLDRSAWDERDTQVRYEPGREAEVVLGDRTFTGRVVPVPGRADARFRAAPTPPAGPRRVVATLRFAALPSASFWYRTPETVEVRLLASSAGVTSVLGTWRLDPRLHADDRGPHQLTRELLLLPGRDATLSVETAVLGSHSRTPPILAELELSPAA